MANCRLLAASELLVNSLEEVLAEARIEYRHEGIKSSVRGRHRYDLSVYQCEFERGKLELVIERRHGRMGADVVLIPARFLFVFPDRNAELLAEKLVMLFCSRGASESPDARCEAM